MESAPGRLADGGPIAPVTIAVPDAVRLSRGELGFPVPEPVNGFALIDTGATRSCFDSSAAARAGLPTVGTSKMASASHPENDVPLYTGKMMLPGLNFDVEAGFGVEVIRH